MQHINLIYLFVIFWSIYYKKLHFNFSLYFNNVLEHFLLFIEINLYFMIHLRLIILLKEYNLL